MEMMRALFWGSLKMILIAGGVFYAVLVLTAYAGSGAYPRPTWDENDALGSAKQYMVWLGVSMMALLVRVARPLLNVLWEGSADVGEWVMARHQARVEVPPRGN
jgi:hypothetical protein